MLSENVAYVASRPRKEGRGEGGGSECDIRKKLNFPWSLPLYTMLATTVHFTVFPKKPCDLPPPPPKKKKRKKKKIFVTKFNSKQSSKVMKRLFH